MEVGEPLVFKGHQDEFYFKFLLSLCDKLKLLQDLLFPSLILQHYMLKLLHFCIIFKNMTLSEFIILGKLLNYIILLIHALTAIVYFRLVIVNLCLIGIQLILERTNHLLVIIFLLLKVNGLIIKLLIEFYIHCCLEIC